MLYCIGAPIVLVLIGISLFTLARHGLTLGFVLKGTFLLFIVAAACYMIPIFLSTIYANEFGIELRQFSKTKEQFSWKQIETVVQPRFGIPHDVSYIVLANGKRIAVGRSMSGYNELLEMIQARSPNLAPKQLPANLVTPAVGRFWWQLLLWFALFIGYIFFRVFH